MSVDTVLKVRLGDHKNRITPTQAAFYGSVAQELIHAAETPVARTRASMHKKEVEVQGRARQGLFFLLHTGGDGIGEANTQGMVCVQSCKRRRGGSRPSTMKHAWESGGALPPPIRLSRPVEKLLQVLRSSALEMRSFSRLPATKLTQSRSQALRTPFRPLIKHLGRPRTESIEEDGESWLGRPGRSADGVRKLIFVPRVPRNGDQPPDRTDRGRPRGDNPRPPAILTGHWSLLSLYALVGLV